MNILFIHGNFPGQFKYLASSLGRDKNNNIVFLTQRSIAECPTTKGVQIRNFNIHRTSHESTHHYIRACEDAVIKGQAIVREIHQLANEGFTPRVIIYHGGMGYGLFIKDVLPNTKTIGLYEWYFTNKTQGWATGKWDINTQLMANTRNLPINQEIMSCDAPVVPTEWQKKQFPKRYKEQLNCIFDGIDVSFFKPDQQISSQDIYIQGEENESPIKINKDEPLITYMTRGMEPLRGFPEFMQTLPHVLKNISNAKVIIAGRDRTAYSYPAPTEGGSWKRSLMKKLGDFDGKERIHFTGLLSYGDYVNMLKRSNLHCYLTRPYVTSWSFLEAAACGTPMLISDNEATRGLLMDESTGTWIDLEEPAEIMAQKICDSIKLDRNIPRKANLKNDFKLTNCLKQWECLINKVLA